MYIDATGSEFTNYTPNSSGIPIPEVGNYPGIYHVCNAEPGETNNKEPKFIITFECLDGTLKGQKVQIHYLTGSSNDTARRIAIEAIIDIASVITEVNQANKRFEFNEKMYFKPFEGLFIVANQINKQTGDFILDDNGNPRKNVRFKGLKPISNNNNQPVNNAVAQGQYNQAPAQQQQYNNAGQQQNASPSWAR